MKLDQDRQKVSTFFHQLRAVVEQKQFCDTQYENFLVINHLNKLKMEIMKL